jgi:hypothetical protein
MTSHAQEVSMRAQSLASSIGIGFDPPPVVWVVILLVVGITAAWILTAGEDRPKTPTQPHDQSPDTSPHSDDQ